ncbi:ferritin-like domain-containing protein [Herbaspirillum sp. RTI4]|uniref:ferritin-like domain-containing protein n=1 Tax=Herbaspirillum sp. RTI4 TaxID=3048640 RepID=UPI002AB5ABAC|nr:ferritin-like domain-containing protein [Herbaspirillum sp. RTI4]MDY7577410.1 ferritin-like domain-containing protein [Herbaspirillum sp. RTI4]MEA9981686.1 ferritin-like domain-containing protein [Herbaspirillum sp. RTI4]
MTIPLQDKRHWKITDLDFSCIDIPATRRDENLFYLLACASFVESGANVYASNLVDFYRNDAELSDWLRNHWEVEELQHGAALRAYVNYVWPEFDWERAYRSFLGEYAGYCKVELLESTRTQELAARCVVETGTATYYRALARSTSEPVLRQLAHRIADDEVSHYKQFYRSFRRYREQEGTGRLRTLGTLCRRTLELKSEDADCAIRHVIKIRDPLHADDVPQRQRLLATMNHTVRTHLTPDTTIKMIMKPLELPPMLQSMVQYPLIHFMQRVFLR